MQANSMFFDTIKLYYPNDTLVPLKRTGIAWQSDKNKFKNPANLNNPKDPMWLFFSRPISWGKHIWELDANFSNNGVKNEDFIVWMVGVLSHSLFLTAN